MTTTHQLPISYTPTNIWKDGTAMTDKKVDGVIYRKEGKEYVVDLDFVINKQIRLSRYIPSDGKFHSIRSIFPDVTLDEVQAIEPKATLDSSAAWYIISKLLTWIPKYTNINPDCDVIIDEEIVIKRGFFKMQSTGLWVNNIDSNPYKSRRPTIDQISTGKDVFAFVDGDGTIHSLGTVEDIWMKGFNLRHVDYTGDGISLRYSTYQPKTNSDFAPTLINLNLEDMTITGFKWGIKKYSGHINNLFFTNVTASSNFNLGMDFPSDSKNQTNYVAMYRCTADANGLEWYEGKIENYKQIEGQENYDKGGIRISGTSINIYDVALQLNAGLGLHYQDYIAGGFVTGYAEQNQIGDFGTLSENPDAFRNCQVNLYTLEKRYYIPNERVRMAVDPEFAAKQSREYALKTFSHNLVKETKEIELSQNIEIHHVEVSHYSTPMAGDIYSLSFDIMGRNFKSASIGLSQEGNATIWLESENIEPGKWTHIQRTIYVKNDQPDNLFSVIKRPASSSFRIRNIILRKFANPDEIPQDAPMIEDSNATTIRGLKADFNKLLAYLKLR